jgi:hypothetical protein
VLPVLKFVPMLQLVLKLMLQFVQMLVLMLQLVQMLVLMLHISGWPTHKYSHFIISICNSKHAKGRIIF